MDPSANSRRPPGRAATLRQVDDLEQRLAAAHAAVQERDTVRVRLRTADDQLKAAQQELDAAQRAADLETADVERLESFSGARVWAVLKGSRDTDLQREQAEADAAVGKAAEAKARRDGLAHERDALADRLQQLTRVDAELAAAEQAMQEHRIATSPNGPRLLELAAERGRLQAQQRELQEAVLAGGQAEASIEELQHELGTASGWSTYDTFFGGGLIASSIKHDHMDRAAELSRATDQSLARFRRELGDVNVEGVDLALSMSEGTRFLDTWFDNIFTDLSVRGQIEHAKERAAAAAASVAKAVETCGGRLQDVGEQIAALDAQRQALLQEQ